MVTVSLTRCLWGLIGNSEVQIDGEPLLGTGGSWMPGQCHKNPQADPRASRERSEGFWWGGSTAAPVCAMGTAQMGPEGAAGGFREPGESRSVSRGRCHPAVMSLLQQSTSSDSGASAVCLPAWHSLCTA